MKRIILAIICATLLGGCAHWQNAHGGHSGHAGDAANCQGKGKEGDMCPLRSKDSASGGMPDCCKGKMQQATPSSN